MERSADQIVQEWLDLQEEHRQLSRELDEAEERGEVRVVDPPKIDLSEFDGTTVADVERMVEEFGLVQAILELREKNQELRDHYNATLARLDQKEGQHQELEAKHEEVKGINSGLRNAVEGLQEKLRDQRP
jgi:hypothetical protein